jgi:hypothetical protein
MSEIKALRICLLWLRKKTVGADRRMKYHAAQNTESRIWVIRMHEDVVNGRLSY